MFKKLVFACVMSIAAFSFVACGGNKPKDVAVSFLEAAAKGDGDELAKFVQMRETMTKGKLKMMAADMAKKTEALGGLKSIEVISEEINGDTAKVRVKMTFGDDKSKEEYVRLIKVKDEWKIKLYSKSARENDLWR